MYKKFKESSTLKSTFKILRVVLLFLATIATATTASEYGSITATWGPFSVLLTILILGAILILWTVAWELLIKSAKKSTE